MKVMVKDIIEKLEHHFPAYLAEPWDNVGLHIGSVKQRVEKVMVCLDIDDYIVEQAVKNRVNLIISHHPLIFDAIKTINYDDPQGKLITRLIRAKISVYCAHTNLDAAPHGLNQILAEKIGLERIEPLYQHRQEQLMKLAVFVPVNHVDQVREAIAQAGAGNIGKYSDCTFRVEGIGTFRPGEDANPFIGTANTLEEVQEYRLETVVYEKELERVLKAMQASHPYEEVAYDLYRLNNQGFVYSLGRKGHLNQARSLEELAVWIKACLGLEEVGVSGELTSMVNKVAVVCGSGGSMIDVAVAQGVDVLITGDLKYHDIKRAEANGLFLIDAGHQGTERIVIDYLCGLLNSAFRNVAVLPCQNQAVLTTI
ncbi:MAG: Nif3-like dinuclear metal center hexameric protein [Syntrophomonadaceae bacterium]|nr:Nif3-like dinuclear metal center hexameric protein [Syntrophomonadaceae bacterium]